MYVVTVTFILKPGSADVFMPVMCRQAKLSLQLEDACQQFDIAVDPKDENRVFLYEIYDDESSFGVHLKSSHFREFGDSIAKLVQDKHVDCWELVEYTT
jgi:quinol monooxygenase YgiN